MLAMMSWARVHSLPPTLLTADDWQTASARPP